MVFLGQGYFAPLGHYRLSGWLLDWFLAVLNKVCHFIVNVTDKRDLESFSQILEEDVSLVDRMRKKALPRFKHIYSCLSIYLLCCCFFFLQVLPVKSLSISSNFVAERNESGEAGISATMDQSFLFHFSLVCIMLHCSTISPIVSRPTTSFLMCMRGKSRSQNLC